MLMVLMWWQWRDGGGSDEVGVAMVMCGENGSGGDGSEGGGEMVFVVMRGSSRIEGEGRLWWRRWGGKDIKVKKSKNEPKPTRNEETSDQERDLKLISKAESRPWSRKDKKVKKRTKVEKGSSGRGAWMQEGVRVNLERALAECRKTREMAARTGEATLVRGEKYSSNISLKTQISRPFLW
ncbi:hypothetical protein Tco_0554246 [Tanacetum coccineum]